MEHFAATEFIFFLRY